MNPGSDGLLLNLIGSLPSCEAVQYSSQESAPASPPSEHRVSTALLFRDVRDPVLSYYILLEYCPIRISPVLRAYLNCLRRTDLRIIIIRLFTAKCQMRLLEITCCRQRYLVLELAEK